jgi:hypothetical protein
MIDYICFCSPSSEVYLEFATKRPLIQIKTKHFYMLRPLLGHSLSQKNKKGRAIRDEPVKICTICFRDETSDIRDLVSLV